MPETTTDPKPCPKCGNDMWLGNPNDIRTGESYFHRTLWYCTANFKGESRYEGGCGYTEEIDSQI